MWLDQEASDAEVMCRRGAPGRIFVSSGVGIGGSRSSLGTPVPGRDVYSGKVVMVDCLESGTKDVVLGSPPRFGKVGCRLKSVPSLKAFASCRARISFSFLRALSVLVRTILSILLLILVLQYPDRPPASLGM